MPQSVRRLSIPFALIVSVTLFARDKDAVKMYGDLEGGIGYVDYGMTNAYYNIVDRSVIQITRAKVEFTASIVPDVSAHLDLRGDANKLGLQIKKAYARFDVGDALQVNVGSIRKHFGMEDTDDEGDLYTINKSLVFTLMDSFHALGFDATLQLRRVSKDYSGLSFPFWVNISADGDLGGFANGTFAVRSKAGELSFSNLFCYHYYRHNYDIGDISYQTAPAPLYLNVELTGGINPAATELAERIGAKATVYFAGVRTLEGYCLPFSAGLISGLEPLLEEVYMAPSFQTSGIAQAQLVPGFNVYFGSGRKARWMTNFEIVFSNDTPHKTWTRMQNGAYSQVQLLW